MESKKKFKNIVFLNNLSEADQLLGNNGLNSAGEENLLMAMNPSVRAYLKSKGIAAQDTLPYFTNESHKETLRKSKDLADWLKARADFTDLGMGVERAYKDFFIYWTRFSIHHCLWAIEIISNAVEAHYPDKIYAHLSNKIIVTSLYIEPEESYFGQIVKAVSERHGIEFGNIFADRNARSSSSSALAWKEDLSRALAKARRKKYIGSLVKFALQCGKFQLWEWAVSARRLFLKKKPVFFTTKFYQMDKLAASFKEKTPDKLFYFLKGPVIFTFGLSDLVIRLFSAKHSNAIISQKRKFSCLDKEIRQGKELFSYKNVSFAEMIAQKIEDNIAGHILGLMLWTVKLNHFIGSVEPSAFISNGNRADDVILAELCLRRNIPAVLISHGSHVYPKNEFERIEWGELGRALLSGPFSRLALQSPLSEGYLEALPTSSKIIKTGPLIWGTYVNPEKSMLLFEKMFGARSLNRKDIRIITHAATPKASNSLRFYVYETPDEYIKAIQDITAAVENMPNVILIVKFRPSREISVDDLRSFIRFSDKVVLSVNEPFLDVLGMTDMLVSFSSTTIEEALQNRIPVLLYGGGGRYKHIDDFQATTDLPQARSAVYHAKETADLESAIPAILGLNIDGKGRDRELFDPYIYSQDIRQPIEGLLDI
ncbi:MAG: hypothetical protein V1933_03740 [Candidatus Omnitrophota bacterium]